MTTCTVLIATDIFGGILKRQLEEVIVSSGCVEHGK